jgi:two-component system nitrogen regulation response regulator GlnG
LRLGAVKAVKVDVRMVTASNQELQRLVTSGQMREDLFFRLNEFTITIPPLRERKDDIPYLAKRFMDLTNKELQKRVRRFSEYCLEALMSYNWPGNVRQLRSVIRRAVLLADDLITENIWRLLPCAARLLRPRFRNALGRAFSEIVHRSWSPWNGSLSGLKHTQGNSWRPAYYR